MPAQLKRIQQIVRACLYYCRATEPLTLVALGTIASEQSDGDEATIKTTSTYLFYLTTLPNGTVTCENHTWSYKYIALELNLSKRTPRAE